MEDSVSDDEWRKVEDALSSLITSKTRADGKNWEDAFGNMQVYLQVSISILALKSWANLRFTNAL